MSTTETILKQTMNKAKCESVNVEWIISAFNIAWYSVQVLLHKYTKIKNSKDIIKNGGYYSQVFLGGSCLLFLPKVFSETRNYVKLNTPFRVVSVKKNLGGNKVLSVPECSIWKFFFHFFKPIFDSYFRLLRSFFSNWDSFVQMINVISEWNYTLRNKW